MRKVWLGVSVGIGLSFSFVALLVVGTYMIAADLVGGGSGTTLGLAKGSVPASYQPLVQKWGNLCPAINPPLLAAQLYQESGWNPKAQSPADARGIAQFIPATWATHGVDGDKDGDRDIWDPEDAIPSAASYDCSLAKYVKDVPGDQTHNMLASYNAGAYAVIKYDGVPPYRETQNYVKTITTLAKSFAAPRQPVASSQQSAGAIYFAQKQLGKPYLWGGNGTADQDGRFDCSGLTKAAYASVGIELPRVANDQWNAGRASEAGRVAPRRPGLLRLRSERPTVDPPRGDLCGRRLHDQCALHRRGDPVRQDRFTGLHRRDAGDGGWRKSAARPPTLRKALPLSWDDGSPFGNVRVIVG